MDRGMDGWMEEGENGGGVGRNAKGEARKSTSPAKFGGGRGTSGLVIVASSNRKNRGGGRDRKARITPARHATLEKGYIRDTRKAKEERKVEGYQRWWRHGDEREGWSRKRSE